MEVPGKKVAGLGACNEAESDESLERICQPCSDDGHKLAAAGFCVDCGDYLCTECYKYHCKPKQTRHHVLQDKGTMPKRNPQTTNSPETVDKCPQHPGELVNFYCRSHDQLGCGVCFMISHKTCDGVSYVEEEYDQLSRTLGNLERQVDNNASKACQNTIDIESCSSDAVENIKQYRAEINEWFDKLESEAEMTVNELQRKDQKVMTSITAQCDTSRCEIHSVSSELERLHNTKQNGKLFAVMDKTKVKLKTIEEDLSQVTNDNKIKQFVFERENRLQDLMASLDKLGKITFVDDFNKESKTNMNIKPSDIDINKKSESSDININKKSDTGTSKITSGYTENKTSTTDTDNSTTKLEISNSIQPSALQIFDKHTKKSATLIADINIKTKSESCGNASYIPSVTGLVLLADNQIVIVDYSNRKVKLLDTKHNKIAAELKLPRRPWDVTRIDNNQVAVTIPRDNKIQILSVHSDTLSVSDEITVNGECWGIVSNNDTFIVTFVSPGKVEIIDMTLGQVLRTIVQGSMMTIYQSKRLFKSHKNVAMSPDKMAIYVSDQYNNTVTCMTLTGDVQAVYKDGKLRDPRGMAIDQTGTVYVCGFDSNNIHQITAKCTKIQILLQDEVRNPFSLTYSDREDKLYVGMNSNSIKVVQIK